MADDNRTYPQTMIRLFMSYIPTRVIYVAAKLGLADHIADDGASAQDLARNIDLHPGALYRVGCNALCRHNPMSRSWKFS